MTGLLKKPPSFANGVEREFEAYKRWCIELVFAQNKDIGTALQTFITNQRMN